MSRTISQSLMWDRSSSGGTNSSAVEPTSKTSGCRGVGLALPRPEPLRQCPGQGVSHLSPAAERGRSWQPRNQPLRAEARIRPSPVAAGGCHVAPLPLGNVG